MRLLSIFRSDGGHFGPGWWAEIEDDAGQRMTRFLWENESEPVFHDLAGVVSELAPVHGLETALELARLDRRLVRREEPTGDYEPPAVLTSSEEAKDAGDHTPCGLV